MLVKHSVLIDSLALVGIFSKEKVLVGATKTIANFVDNFTEDGANLGMKGCRLHRPCSGVTRGISSHYTEAALQTD